VKNLREICEKVSLSARNQTRTRILLLANAGQDDNEIRIYFRSRQSIPINLRFSPLPYKPYLNRGTPRQVFRNPRQ